VSKTALQQETRHLAPVWTCSCQGNLIASGRFLGPRERFKVACFVGDCSIACWAKQIKLALLCQRVLWSLIGENSLMTSGYEIESEGLIEWIAADSLNPLYSLLCLADLHPTTLGGKTIEGLDPASCSQLRKNQHKPLTFHTTGRIIAAQHTVWYQRTPRCIRASPRRAA
jgi:hypothetical protein